MGANISCLGPKPQTKNELLVRSAKSRLKKNRTESTLQSVVKIQAV